MPSNEMRLLINVNCCLSYNYATFISCTLLRMLLICEALDATSLGFNSLHPANYLDIYGFDISVLFAMFGCFRQIL